MSLHPSRRSSTWAPRSSPPPPQPLRSSPGERLRSDALAMAVGERHSARGQSQLGPRQGRWLVTLAGRRARRPGRAGRTHREGRGCVGSGAGPQGDKPHPPRGPSCHLPPRPGHPSSIHPSSPQVALHLVRPWGSRPGKRAPSDAVQPVPTCTVPSAKTGEEGTPDWLPGGCWTGELGPGAQAPPPRSVGATGKLKDMQGPRLRPANPTPTLPKSDST